MGSGNLSSNCFKVATIVTIKATAPIIVPVKISFDFLPLIGSELGSECISF